MEINESDLRKQRDDIQNALDKVTDQVKGFGDKVNTEIKNLGKVTESTKEAADKALAEQGELRAALNDMKAEIAKLDQRSHERETMEAKSIGSQVIDSEAFKAFSDSGQSKLKVPVKGLRLGSMMAKILEGSGGAGNVPVPQRIPQIIMPGQQRLTIRDLLSWGRTTVSSLQFVRETGFTNSADVVSENPAAGKPESNITFELDTANVATVAHFIMASRQVLEDAPQLQGYIDGRLMYGLALKEEAQLLKGSGTGLNLDGIYTQASAYANPGVTVQHETTVDVLRLAILQAELANYYADGIVLNPIDWTQIELTKDSQNRYILANPFNNIIPMLWARPVVSTKSMDAGDFLVGAFAQGAQGWDRDDASVTISLEDRDNFIKNMVTVLCEERLALTVYRPEAFVKGALVTSS